MKIRSLFLSFVALMFCQPVFSAVYTWSRPTLNQQYESALAACQAYSPIYSGYTTTGLERIEPRNGSDTQFSCVYSRVRNSTGEVSTNSSTYVVRSGNECPVGTVYNVPEGPCETPYGDDGTWCATPGTPAGSKNGIVSGGRCVNEQEATLANQCRAYSQGKDQKTYKTWKYPNSSSADLRNPQKAADAIGCEVQLLEDVSCKTYPARIDPPYQLADGSMSDPVPVPKSQKCTTTGVLTGNVAPSPTGTPAENKCEGDECEITPIEQTSDQKPCTYQTDAEGRQSCVSWDYKGKEGAEQCGTVNGTYACKNDLPQAVGKGIAVGTVVETQALADGKTKVTKTDTAKTTNCIGAGACTTTTTTNKTTTIKNGDGSIDSQTGTCTGPQCPSGTNPDGNGDGLGDCTGPDCDDQAGEPGSVTAPELEDVPGFGESMTTFMASIQEAPIISSVTDISFPEGGTCPTGTVDLPFGPVSFDFICQMAPDMLQPLYYLFLACWAFIAIRTYLTA